jgi:Cof subfamily protein (haloacid dehalogenase superfamily)
MTDIKAVFFDIDGTLLSKSQPRMTPLTLSSLRALREQGILVFLATGREATEVRDLHIEDDFRFDGKLMVTGGYCTYHDQLLCKAPIPKKDAELVIQRLSDWHIAATFVWDNGFFINFIDDNVRSVYAKIYTPMPQIEDPHTFLDRDIFCITTFSTPNDTLRVIEGMDLKYTSWFDESFDIIPADSGKRQGMLEVSRQLGIPLSSMMAFGDGQNDQDMLETAGIGIAMANGEPSLKSIADYICSGVDEEGITEGLRHYLMIQ